MLYRSLARLATASIKTATIRAFLSFWQNLKNRVRQSTLDFSEPAKKRQKSIKFSPF